jgi:hypothetical protein
MQYSAEVILAKLSPEYNWKLISFWCTLNGIWNFQVQVIWNLPSNILIHLEVCCKQVECRLMLAITPKGKHYGNKLVEIICFQFTSITGSVTCKVVLLAKLHRNKGLFFGDEWLIINTSTYQKFSNNCDSYITVHHSFTLYIRVFTTKLKDFLGNNFFLDWNHLANNESTSTLLHFKEKA